MGHVRTRVLAHAPIEILFEMAQKVENFSKFVPALKEVKTLERSEDGVSATVEWTAQAKLLGATRSLTWIQNDEWDRKNFVCRFCLCQSSDMQRLNGKWEFRQHPKGTEMIFDIDFQVQHPLVTSPIHLILDRIMRRNNESMLKGLKRKAEQEFWTRW